MLPLTDVNDIIPYFSLQTGGLTPSDPVSLPMAIDLGTMTAADSGWRNLLTAINTAGKYIDLDLSACTMTGTGFDPDNSDITGKDRIVSLILPNAATYVMYVKSSGTETGTPNHGQPLFYGFSGFSELTRVEGLYVTRLLEGSFAHCTSLTKVNFPAVTETDAYTFYGCTSLTEVNLPALERIRDHDFNHCTSLTKVSFPAVTWIDNNAFSYCTSLTEVSLPMAKEIGNYAFTYCTSLTSMSIPQVTEIRACFAGTGTCPLTITMGLTPPSSLNGGYMFSEMGPQTTKIVTIKVPASATGYGTFTGSPPTITLSGDPTDSSVSRWGYNFRNNVYNINIILYIVQEN
jgi:hypothetical protein